MPMTNLSVTKPSSSIPAHHAISARSGSSADATPTQAVQAAPRYVPNEAASPAAKNVLKALSLNTPTATAAKNSRGAQSAQIGAQMNQASHRGPLKRATAAAALGLAILGTAPACLAGTVHEALAAGNTASATETVTCSKAPMSLQEALIQAKFCTSIDDPIEIPAHEAPTVREVYEGLENASRSEMEAVSSEATHATAGKQNVEDLQQEITRDSVNRGVKGIKMPAEQLAALRRDVSVLNQLPSVPDTVAGKRQWVATHKPQIEKSRLAAFALKEDAFFVDDSLDAEAKAAETAVKQATQLLTRVEEQAGLRRPEPPRDPNRPYGELQAGMDANVGTSPIFDAVAPALRPVAALADFMDWAGRSAEKDSHPEAMRAYEARLAEYERARTQ